MTLPDDFINQTKAFMDNALWQTLSNALTEDAPVSIRLNAEKCCGRGVTVADADGKVAWCDGGYYLKSRPTFTFDPLLHAGLYYVQEASSMFLHRVLSQYIGTEPVVALDLCAAPGGKSTVARAVLPEGSLLVCNEPVRSRAQILAENMQKFGHEDVIVTNNYPKDVRQSGLMFDVIIADVPCSGEGMFRKDATAVSEWSLNNVENCSRLQAEIIAEAWRCLKPGGLLVYSTCTFNLHENEENIRQICQDTGAELLSVDTEEDWQITGSLLAGFNKPVYRFLPGRTRGEGIFMAALRKPADGTEEGRKEKGAKPKKERRNKEKNGGVKADLSCLKQPERFEAVAKGSVITAVPKAWKQIYDAADKHLCVLSAGVPLCEVKGKDAIPQHGLALSRALNPAAFTSVELDYGQAISYLRKEAVALPAETGRGYVLVTYKGFPLGFEKNIGNRANNMYPAEWRIKSTHTPDKFSDIITVG